MDLLLATRNAHKAREIQRILGPDFAVSDLCVHPEIPEIQESGKSFEENATLKVVAASRYFPGLVIADDSGLEVDALGGAPGIFSARYAGREASDKQNIVKLLGELARAGATGSNRSARFRCVIAFARNDELLGTVEGTLDGTIAEQPQGLHGFGYDPIFVPRGFERTFAELPAELKNTISHRAKATRALAARLAVLRAGA
jgi:XTP/dITP diphosphohydrolase